MSKTNVAVLFGGRSSEHSVSCVTASNIVENLLASGYGVYPVGITQDGQWTYVPADKVQYRFSHDGGEQPTVAKSDWTVYPNQSVETKTWIQTSKSGVKDLADIDVVFPVLHGAYGEDGTIQGLLELADIPYVGSDVLGSSSCMEKHTTKVLLDAAGFEVAPGIVITERTWKNEKAEMLAKAGELKFPVFVKPSRVGSSFGVTKVKDASGLEAAIETARKFDTIVLIEEGIVGREIEFAVLDGDPKPKVSQPSEIVMNDEVEFYDYEAKYILQGAAVAECPAKMPEKDLRAMQKLALKAFDTLQLKDLARVDFFYTEDGKYIINEVNTMPGFTPISGYPLMMHEHGVTYQELLDRLVKLALHQ
ncbi:MAG: D-alanine--D-alanine ligase family protein [Micrococcaceae bacterium]